MERMRYGSKDDGALVAPIKQAEYKIKPGNSVHRLGQAEDRSTHAKSANINKLCACKSNVFKAARILIWQWCDCTDADVFTVIEITLPCAKVEASSAASCRASSKIIA